MPWFRIDDQMAFHAKTVAAGNAAIGLWARAGSWSSGALTDGFIPKHMVTSLGSVAQAKKLVAAGLWSVTDGGYQFHQWGERQPFSKADVERKRQEARARMKAARDAKRGDSSRERDANEPENIPLTDKELRAHDEENAPRSSLNPNPTQPNLLYSSGHLGGESLVPNARENDPPPRSCADHSDGLMPGCDRCTDAVQVRSRWTSEHVRHDVRPLDRCPSHVGVERPPNCGACKDSRLDGERWDAAHAKRVAAAKSQAAHRDARDRARAIDDCPLRCGELGGYIDDGQGGRSLCDHRLPNPDRPSLREQFEAHKRDQAPPDPERVEDATPNLQPEDSHA
jgi:hypothetical protein